MNHAEDSIDYDKRRTEKLVPDFELNYLKETIIFFTKSKTSSTFNN